jgi:Fe-S-cluster-containing dehydrogenase component
VSAGRFVLDLDRCTGCAACVVACSSENLVAPTLAWRAVHTFNSRREPSSPVLHYSLACNHCAEPACLAGCPAAAYSRDPATGAVLLDAGRCMGCRYCAWVCPYAAPRFDADSGVMAKCTLCAHRLAVEGIPACCVACPTTALRFEVPAEPEGLARPGFPDVGLRPALRLAGDRRRRPPALTASLPRTPPLPPPGGPAWQRLRDEWALWLFSTAMIVLVAWYTASVAGGPSVRPPVFAGAGLAALGISALHLGRPARAWRGLRNLRSSWVSREAVLSVAFLAAATVLSAVPGSPGPLHWAIAAVGLAALLAMDLVYRVPGQEVLAVPHSAMATLSGAWILGLLLAAPAIAVPAAAVKAALYLLRRPSGSPAGPTLGAARLLLGLALPCALLAVEPPSPWLPVACAVVGELIDRAEFYAGLRFLTPGLQIERDLLALTRPHDVDVVGSASPRRSR